MLAVLLLGCSRGIPDGGLEPELEEMPDRFVNLSIGRGGGGGQNEEMKAGDLMIIGGMLGNDDAKAAKGLVNAPSAATTAEAEPMRAQSAPADATPEAALRSWFPEAFLWRPSLQTDAQGTAQVQVRVPDQLTTWRVLALAHDGAGHQSGTEHRFDSTMPAYVDPVVPGWSYVGDRFRLPVQIVNNRSTPLAAALSVELEGSLRGSVQQTLALAAYDSGPIELEIDAVSAGTGVLSADLAGIDRVRREWQVRPTGRPVIEQRGGTLSGERTVALRWPSGADPRTAKFQVDVQPGPLSVSMAELERLDGGGAWGQAYAYGVLTHVRALAAATGAEVDPERLRRVQKRAWQRLVRRARIPEPHLAIELLDGLQPGEPGSLEAQLHARLVLTAVNGQRGDGTWSRQERDTLQSILVQTANAGRVLPLGEQGPRLRASGALERFQPNIDDAFTAAVLLASGLLPPTEPVLATLRAGLVPLDAEDPDGAETFRAPPNVVNPWGEPPTDAEARAWMALALLQLEGAPEDAVIAGDLVSQVMGSHGAAGFGAGAADGVLLAAVVAGLPSVAQPIQLTLAVDGRPVSTATVDPKQPGVPARLQGVAPAGEVTLQATPASAGLAFTLTQQSWVPWRGSEGVPGVDLEVVQGPLRAGRKGTLTFTLAAPSGARVTVVQGLPAGTVLDGVEALRSRSDLASVEVEQDHLRFETTPFGAGEIRTLVVTVIPRYAGVLRTQPLELISGRERAQLAPHVWRVDP